MKRLEWRPMAIEDREVIMDYIAEDNLIAAIELDDEFEVKAEQARTRPQMFKVGRVSGTREIVVRPNYIMVYTIEADTVTIMRILHAAQQWPAPKPTTEMDSNL